MHVHRQDPGQPLRPLRESIDVGDGTAVAIGFFDGVHLGHRALLRKVREEAARRDLLSGAVTFATHPAQLIRPESSPRLLTSLEDRLRLLGSTGIDFVFLIEFDNYTRNESPEEFIDRVLVEALSVRTVVVGDNFHFGRDRAGDVQLLRRIGPDLGFDVAAFDLVQSHDHTGQVISSTRIRNLLATDGDVSGAARLLGRPHEVSGVVERGDQRGRTWGFPTANVAVTASLVIPAGGIYSGWLEAGDGDYLPAAIYIGHRPTVYGADGDEVVEVHLLDWDGDIYDRAVRVRFQERIRGDERFDSFDELVAQIGRDVDVARRLLGT